MATSNGKAVAGTAYETYLQKKSNMDDAQKANKALCPPEEDTESAEVYKNLSVETTTYMNDLWKELKAE